eukprot:4863845-Prymnesium_polylepis.1
MKQAYAAQPVAEELSRRRNLDLAAQLDAHGEESKRLGLCSGHGIYTLAMPWSTRAHMTRGRFCHCFPGWFGQHCEFGPGYQTPPVPREKRLCPSSCSDRGICR